MRFRAPRSVSPSPVRGKPRSSSTFGIQSDSDSEDYNSEVESSFALDSDDDDANSVASTSSSSSFELVADINKLSLRPRNITRTPLEQRQIDETVAAIRLRAHYTDPYEEWEKETRKEAMKTARQEYMERQLELQKAQERQETLVAQKYAQHRGDVNMDFDRAVVQARQSLLDQQTSLTNDLKERTKKLWKKIEVSIKAEEERVATRLEAERKAKAEEEQKQKEAELKKRIAAEKLLQEETARKKAAAEKKQAEEEKERREQEELSKQKKLEEEQSKREDDELELRKMLNLSTRSDDWRVARTNLHSLKSGPMRGVKAAKELRLEWGKLRRSVVPKIGQLTNDPVAIARISQQIIEICRPPGGSHDPTIYIALLSSVSKTIILQAETEVTAEKRSAGPLAQVAFALLDTLEHFPTIFFAKLVQRCGGWPIPIVVPALDIDELPWNTADDRVKASGVRKSINGQGLESTEEYSNRISSVMRVYFHILKIRPVNGPLHEMFQLPRCWAWFARMTSDPRLLRDPVAPQLLYTGLDVLGLEAVDVWGQQWVKMLGLVHEGITVGYEKDKLIGGNSAEGAAARTRVMVALENIVNGVES
ncbi:hypothetical protein HYPSUDRAFT_140194 [Hypholoma sublateritium FD-334 SS-4]|uniref:mRNA export factor GLE1 n=1 Tax=Hypholoma sublateritium (strain FD-334 SS-4) TaxID=945553 RepID=A0A0D2L4R0_HYPSF|nr:hypothetical protein HYPSUDRAFT_140194 [Hypholoma sublateritium FD-334 SS-4]